MSSAASRSVRRRTLVASAGAAAAGLVAPFGPVRAQAKDRLRIAHVGSIATLNPLFAFDDVGYIVRALFPPLTQFAQSSRDPRQGWSPLIATPTDVQVDGSTFYIDIKLPKPARRWAAGSHNTAEEIARGLAFAKDALAGRPQLSVHGIADASVLDDSTCRLKLRTRDMRLFKGTFTRPWATPLSQQMQDLLRKEKESVRPTDGLGPYVLKYFAPQTSVELMANRHWNGRTPSVPYVWIVPFPNAKIALAKFAAGDYDVVRVSADDLHIQDNEVTKLYGAGIASQTQVVDSVVYIGMDIDDRDDSATNQRTAARAAISPVKTALAARGEGGAVPTSELLPISQNLKPRAATTFHSPDRARQLLASAASRIVRLHAPESPPADLARAMQSVASQLADVGFDVRRVVLNFGRPRPPGQGLSLFLARTPVVRDPPQAFEAFVSRSPTNTTGFAIAALDRAFADAIVRGDERDSLMDTMQRIVDERAAAIPLYQERQRFLYRPWLRPAFGADGHLGDLIDFGVAR